MYLCKSHLCASLIALTQKWVFNCHFFFITDCTQNASSLCDFNLRPQNASSLWDLNVRSQNATLMCVLDCVLAVWPYNVRPKYEILMCVLDMRPCWATLMCVLTPQYAFWNRVLFRSKKKRKDQRRPEKIREDQRRSEKIREDQRRSEKIK